MFADRVAASAVEQRPSVAERVAERIGLSADTAEVYEAEEAEDETPALPLDVACEEYDEIPPPGMDAETFRAAGKAPSELAAEVAPDGTTLEIYEGLRDLPFYDEDLDGDTPPAAATPVQNEPLSGARFFGLLAQGLFSKRARYTWR